MEERKRSAVSSVDDIAPPSKRQAVNGSSKARDDAIDTKDEAWIEEYQKDAIYRQMLEYKRDNQTLELRLGELLKRSEHYDDHLRIIDAWWLQLVQEIEVVVKGTIVSQHDQEDFKPTNKLDFDSSPDFQRHLAEKSKTIKPMIESLFSNLAGLRGDVKPDVLELESQVSSLLEKEKEYIVKVDRLNSEKDDLSEQLDTAMLRYVKAEKRLDRAKSAQVQKLDSQAFAIATRRPAPSATENGQESGETNGNNEELQLKYREAEAVMAKQKEQLESALSEMKTLREENSSLKARRESLTDEDYVRTDVFKQFKHQNEDLIKRINDLETTNKQLRHEAEKLQTERHSFRTQLEREAETVAGELEDQIQIRDQDLTRIRSTRDELMADQSIRKASQEQERSAVEHMKELVGAREDRISALELELERLRPSAEATSSDPRPDVEALSQDELREKYLKLEKDFESINKELPSIEKAYKRTVGLAQKKVMDFTALEEKVTLLTLEKSKADQKYFAVRKDADINATKLKTLQSQNNKSSEIITALKEHDAQARALVSNLEKQLTDLKQSNVAVMEENRGTKSSSAEALRRSEQVKTQITELQNLVKSKDSMTMAMKEQTMKQETEVERLKVRFDDVKKERDTWKTKSLSNISDDEDMLRNFALCTICRSEFKDAVLKTCGHVFCNGCLEDRITNRMRKCPGCAKSFDKTDIMPLFMSA